MINSLKKGFTLLEILLTVAAVGILAGIVVLAINPNKQLGQARDAQRQADLNTLMNALYQYSIEEGDFPVQIPENPTEICQDGPQTVAQITPLKNKQMSFWPSAYAQEGNLLAEFDPEWPTAFTSLDDSDWNTDNPGNRVEINRSGVYGVPDQGQVMELEGNSNQENNLYTTLEIDASDSVEINIQAAARGGNSATSVFDVFFEGSLVEQVTPATGWNTYTYTLTATQDNPRFEINAPQADSTGAIINKIKVYEVEVDEISLESIILDGDQIEVKYAKNFNTCAHLYYNNPFGFLDHSINFMCQQGEDLTATADMNQFNVRPMVGDEIKICHGNNNSLCSETVLVQEAADPDPEPETCFEASINFTLSDEGEYPEGYESDYGAPYSAKENGLTYGWDQDITNDARRRNRNEDLKNDTLIHLEKSGDRTWEMQVPNGTYQVEIGFGDPSYTNQVNTMLIEGETLVDADGQDNYDVFTGNVEVTDGKFTLRPTEGSSNSKVNYIHLTQNCEGDGGDEEDQNDGDDENDQNNEGEDGNNDGDDGSQGGSGNESCVDLSALSENEIYLTDLPEDPTGATDEGIGYFIQKSDNNRITLSAPYAERSEIEISR